MKKNRIFIIALMALFISGCAKNAKQQDYTAYKQSQPRSILVLPPTNTSPDINASLSVLSVTTFPLAEAGYYVMPVTLVNETLKQNGVTVAGQAHEIPYNKLHSIFGADTALYINVSKYGSSYQVFSSVVEVSADAKLVDLRNGLTLWQGTVEIQDSSSTSGGVIGMLVNAVVSQVANSLMDKGHSTARVASMNLLSAGQPNGLLYGPYHPKYKTD